jgi:hypothetical protein
VGFDVLTTCQPSTVWCSRERLPAAAAQPAKARQSCSATDFSGTRYRNVIGLFYYTRPCIGQTIDASHQVLMFEVFIKQFPCLYKGSNHGLREYGPGCMDECIYSWRDGKTA